MVRAWARRIFRQIAGLSVLTIPCRTVRDVIPNTTQSKLISFCCVAVGNATMHAGVITAFFLASAGSLIIVADAAFAKPLIREEVTRQFVALGAIALIALASVGMFARPLGVPGSPDGFIHLMDFAPSLRSSKSDTRLLHDFGRLAAQRCADRAGFSYRYLRAEPIPKKRRSHIARGHAIVDNSNADHPRCARRDIRAICSISVHGHRVHLFALRASLAVGPSSTRKRAGRSQHAFFCAWVSLVRGCREFLDRWTCTF